MERRIAYKILLTKEETETVSFVGYRYCWSDALDKLISYNDNDEPEEIQLTESEAWELKDEFEKDTEGGHSFFPMLDHDSSLASKLFDFMESIV